MTGSRTTAAVRPTPEEPLPVVYTPRGLMLDTYLSSWLLATPCGRNSRQVGGWGWEGGV